MMSLSRKGSVDLKEKKESSKKLKEKTKRDEEEPSKRLRDDLKRDLERPRRPSDQGSFSKDSFKGEYKDSFTGELMSGWVKVRGPLKSWHTRWVVCKPGKLSCYKDEKAKESQAVIYLNGCKVTQRPTKKEGYCFKVFHPQQANIYSGNSITSGLMPISSDHSILRVTTEKERDQWLNAIELAIASTAEKRRTLDEDSSYERKDTGDHHSDIEHIKDNNSAPEVKEDKKDSIPVVVRSHKTREENRESKRNETIYTVDSSNDGGGGEGAAEEVLGSESKNLILALLKQVRPGMDLHKVVLPTFILEPRSMLEKISDYLTHCELLALVPTVEDPLQRLVSLVKWYLSGFYIKPEGVKKPYNPILGEIFRCRWSLPNGSKTYYVAEQVSHHPPICAFYISNRQAGFVGNGSIWFRSKFTGTSAGSMLDGFCTIHIIPYDEEYEITFPSAWAKGFLFGTLLMELAGNVSVSCRKTGYIAEIEFKQKPLIGGEYNVISAKIKHDKTTLFTITGKWDGEMLIQDSRTQQTSVLWHGTPEVRKSRIPKEKPERSLMQPNESDRLWAKVTEAIKRSDQQTATDEKSKLEQAQRDAAKQRQERGIEWTPRLFVQNDGVWTYKYINKQPWNPQSEIEEIEYNGIVRSRKVDDTSSSASEGEEEEEECDEDDETDAKSEFEEESKEKEKGKRGMSPLANGVVKSTEPEDFQTQIMERLYRIEKDMVLLRQYRPEPVSKPTTSAVDRHFMIIVMLLVVVLAYIYGISSRLAALEQGRSP